MINVVTAIRATNDEFFIVISFCPVRLSGGLLPRE